MRVRSVWLEQEIVEQVERRRWAKETNESNKIRISRCVPQIQILTRDAAHLFIFISFFLGFAHYNIAQYSCGLDREYSVWSRLPDRLVTPMQNNTTYPNRNSFYSVVFQPTRTRTLKNFHISIPSNFPLIFALVSLLESNQQFLHEPSSIFLTR